MNPDLLRQRRNLIAISSILLIFDFADVSIGTVSVLGTELLVGNAKVLMLSAWVLWAYFSLRYYQYWYFEEDQPIRNSYSQRLDKYARTFTSATGVQEPVYGHVNSHYKIQRTGLVTWSYVLPGYDTSSGTVKDGVSYPLSTARLFMWHIKSIFYVLIQTPHATNHILPFVLAVAAPLVTLYMSYVSNK